MRSNIGSCNGLVSSGNKPLPEPMLTQTYWHMASLGHNELRQDFRPPPQKKKKKKEKKRKKKTF